MEKTKKLKLSKKATIIVGGFLLILIILWIGLAIRAANQREAASSALIVNEYTLDELIDNDRDGDGVQDWKELLLGTNPLAFDTNNDGLGDNQLIATINSVYASKAIVQLRAQYPEATDAELLDLFKASTASEGSLTYSEQVGREIYVAGTLLNNLGKLTPELESNLVDGFIKNNIFAYEYPLRITSDLNYQDQYFPEAEFTYIDAVMTAITSDYLDPDPLNILENSIENEDEGLLKRGVQSNIMKLQGIVETMDQIAVPVTFSEEHLELTNSFVRLLVDVREIATFHEDPLVGYSAMLRYQPNLKTHAQVLQAVMNNFTEGLNRISASLVTN